MIIYVNTAVKACIGSRSNTFDKTLWTTFNSFSKKIIAQKSIRKSSMTTKSVLLINDNWRTNLIIGINTEWYGKTAIEINKHQINKNNYHLRKINYINII